MTHHTEDVAKWMESFGFRLEHFGDEVDGTAESLWVDKWPAEGLEIPQDIAAYFYQACREAETQGRIVALGNMYKRRRLIVVNSTVSRFMVEANDIKREKIRLQQLTSQSHTAGGNDG